MALTGSARRLAFFLGLGACSSVPPTGNVQDEIIVAKGESPRGESPGGGGETPGSGGGGSGGGRGASAVEDAGAGGDAGLGDGAVAPVPAVDCSKGGPNDAPPDLSCTGLYEAGSTERLGPGVRPYTPGVTLFSDGAEKRRWVSLPAGTKIDTQDMDHWVFPVGTKFWKEFGFGTKRLETRYFRKVSAFRWVGTTYRWNDAQSRAARLRSGERNANGLAYDIPNEVQCDTCHGGQQDHVLGFEAVGLGLDAAEGLTLERLVAEGLLSHPPSRTRVRLPEDTTGKAAAALGWMHANCGNACHNQNEAAGATFMGLWLRLSAKELLASTGPVPNAMATDSYRTTVNQAPKLGTFLADPSWRRIIPGNPDRSQLLALVRLPRDSAATTMPPLGMRTHDPVGIEAIRAWIAAMPSGSAHP